MDFSEEKEYFRWFKHPHIVAWSQIGSDIETKTGMMIDADIQPFLTLANLLPYVYSAGMSCSGSANDHPNTSLIKRNERFGIQVSEPQGYCVLRANTKEKEWSNFERLLLSISESTLTPSNKWEREDTRKEELFPNKEGRTLFCYQIFLNRESGYTYENIEEAWNHLSHETLKLIQKSRNY